MIHSIANKVKSKLNPPILLKDEYIDWLSFANAGMLNRGNLYCIDYAIANISSENPVLEIGSFCGLSTNIINYYLKKHNKKNILFTADKWEFEGTAENLGDTNIKHSDYKQFVKDSFIRNIHFFSPNQLPHTIEVFSDDFFKLWKSQTPVKDVFNREIKPGGAFSFAFIDGDHTYSASKNDFLNTHEFLEIGGFILFDDSADYSDFGCAKLMKEISKMPNYKLVCKNPNYLFQKIAN